jgi:hypothetical protein
MSLTVKKLKEALEKAKDDAVVMTHKNEEIVHIMVDGRVILGT